MRVDRIDPSYQANFLSGNLPPGTENFYNTKAFAAAEIRFLTTQINEDDQAAARGNQAIEDSINGLS